MASANKKKDEKQDEQDATEHDAPEAATANPAPEATAEGSSETDSADAPADESSASVTSETANAMSDAASWEPASASTTALWSATSNSMSAASFGSSTFGDDVFSQPAPSFAFDQNGLGDSFASGNVFAAAVDTPSFASSVVQDLAPETAPVAADFSPDQIEEMRTSMMARADEFEAMVDQAVAIAFPELFGAIPNDIFG